MRNKKKFISREGAQALRDFAAAMPVAIDNISQSTEKLLTTYNSGIEGLGEHGEAFGEMLYQVKKAQELAASAVEELPKRLEITAAKIDAYVSSEVSISGVGGSSASAFSGSTSSSTSSGDSKPPMTDRQKEIERLRKVRECVVKMDQLQKLIDSTQDDDDEDSGFPLTIKRHL